MRQKGRKWMKKLERRESGTVKERVDRDGRDK